MVKVSAIVPCYNVEQYLRECLDSALAQTLQEIEIICVNDGSTDSTLEILQEYARKDSRIRVLDKPNSGYGSSMNQGMDMARGEYIAILESDDLIKPDMYRSLYELAREKDLDVIKADYEIFVGNGDSRVFTYMRACKKRSLYYRVIRPEDEPDIFNARMNTWTGLYRKSFLDKYHIRHNETAGASYQDNGFWFQTFLWADRLMFVDRAFYQLRRDNPNSSVHNRGKVFCIFEEYAFIEKILRAAPEKEEKLIRIFQKKKWDNCRYHYGRIGDEFKMDFLRRMSDEFKRARAEGELDPGLFYGNGYKELGEIMDRPELFYARTVQEWPRPQDPEARLALLQYRCDGLQEELRALKNSRSYRLGRMLTFLPRKCKGGVRCLKENGLSYTLHRLLEKMGLAGSQKTK